MPYVANSFDAGPGMFLCSALGFFLNSTGQIFMCVVFFKYISCYYIILFDDHSPCLKLLSIVYLESVKY